MVTRSTEVAEQSGSKEIGPVVRAVGGLMLALAVVAGIGGRHLAGQHHAGTAAVQPVDMAPVSRAAPTAPAPALTVYVVGSQEMAEIMRDGLALANLVRVSEPPLRYTVIVVGTETADAVLQALRDDARIVPADGGAPVHVIDLRAAS